MMPVTTQAFLWGGGFLLFGGEGVFLFLFFLPSLALLPLNKI